MTSSPHFDPQDWAVFNDALDHVLDACLTRLKNPSEHPWTPAPQGYDQKVALDGSTHPQDQVLSEMTGAILPYGSGNTHPSFFGWVQGSGTALGLASEIVAATMNANLGGRNSGAVRVEKAVIDWMVDIAGFPNDAFGVLTTGTSQATILAMATARTQIFGKQVLTDGIGSIGPVAVYAAEGVHSCVAGALQILGHGRNAVHKIETDERGAMKVTALLDAIAADCAKGVTPIAIAATAGSVNTGSYDPIDQLADVAHEHGLWLHVDGAFGFWSRLAGAPYDQLTNGMHRADSIATDFHKWLSVPYDSGIVLIRDRELHRQTFADRPEYLRTQSEGLAGADLWYCDYSTDLSRGFKGLKVWAAIRAFGKDHIGDVIRKNIAHAQLMGQLVDASDVLELAHPVISNMCCFRPVNGNAINIAMALQLSGQAVFSTTLINGRNCLRAAVVNHRTSEGIIRNAIAAVEDEVRATL